MKNVRVKKYIFTTALVVKDLIVLLFQCLLATILVSVCIENGWILPNDIADVSYAMFWELYSTIFTLVPLIMLYRGVAGKYRVEIKEVKFGTVMGIAKERAD